MKHLLLLAALAVVVLLGCVKPSSAATVPNVKGLVPFTAQAKYMSLAGYLRWQYFVENHEFISREEAERLVAAQLE